MSWDDDFIEEMNAEDGWEFDYECGLEADAIEFGEVPYEIWKECRGFPGYYVSNFGRIWSKRSRRFRKPHRSSWGNYDAVTLMNEDGQYRAAHIHRLVAEAFRPKRVGIKCNIVRHLDDDRHNNKATNLEWSTQYENMQDSIRNGHNFTRPVLVVDCLENVEYEFNSLKEAAIFLNASHPNIMRAMRNGNAYRKRYIVKYKYGRDHRWSPSR